jgi:hypothetical protein
MRSHTAFRLLPLLFCLSLLFALAGCRQNPDKAAPADGDVAKSADENAGSEGGGDQDQGQGQGGGHRRGPKAHVALAGSLQSEGDFSLDCNLGADKTLQLTLNPLDEKGPKVEVRIANVAAAGEYPATVTIHEQPAAGAARDWTGTAKANLKSHTFGGARKRAGFNGDFSGDFTGQGGKGTVTGNFRRCMVGEAAQ